MPTPPESIKVSLAQRLTETRKSTHDSAGFAAIERGLGEVRDALRVLADLCAS